MAERSLREFSAPSNENIRTGPTLQTRNLEFELKPSLINMVQATPFSGRIHEDARSHLQNFLEIANTFTLKDVSRDIILLRLFPFSLTGKAKLWFYANKEEIRTWDDCSKAFLSKFFHTGKTNALRGKITNFQQQKGESISDAWERLEEYISDSPHHGIEDWLLMQGFYHGLTRKTQEQLDATAEGSFLSLTLRRAKVLMEKISENQSWSRENTQHYHQIKEVPEEVNAVSTKMDVLLDWLDQRDKYKKDRQALQDYIDSASDSSLAVNKSTSTQSK